MAAVSGVAGAGALAASAAGGAAKSGMSIGTALAIASAGAGLLSAVSQYQQGRQAADQYDQAAALQRQQSIYAATLAGRRADALAEKAGQTRASAQRRAAEERRIGRLQASRLTNLAAASGGAQDPTVVGLLGDIDTEAEYRALTGMYEGEELARGYEYGAQLERAGGEGERYAGQVRANLDEQRARSARTGATGALIGGLGRVLGQGAGIYANTIGGSPADTLYSKYAQPYGIQ